MADERTHGPNMKPNDAVWVATLPRARETEKQDWAVIVALADHRQSDGIAPVALETVQGQCFRCPAKYEAALELCLRYLHGHPVPLEGGACTVAKLLSNRAVEALKAIDRAPLSVHDIKGNGRVEARPEQPEPMPQDLPLRAETGEREASGGPEAAMEDEAASEPKVASEPEAASAPEAAMEAEASGDPEAAMEAGAATEPEATTNPEAAGAPEALSPYNHELGDITGPGLVADDAAERTPQPTCSAQAEVPRDVAEQTAATEPRRSTKNNWQHTWGRRRHAKRDQWSRSGWSRNNRWATQAWWPKA